VLVVPHMQGSLGDKIEKIHVQMLEKITPVTCVPLVVGNCCNDLGCNKLR
jgi:hypothetical protein